MSKKKKYKGPPKAGSQKKKRKKRSPKPDPSKKNTKEIGEYTKSYGRDGAYMEFNTENMVESLQSAEVCPSMVVINDARFDVNEKDNVLNLRSIVEHYKNSDECEGMDDAQVGKYVLRKIASAGIELIHSQVGIKKCSCGDNDGCCSCS